MEKAVEAYRHVTATDRFKEIERLRFLARCNEASALLHARKEEARERSLAFARKLLMRNIPIEWIVEDTGLSRAEVEVLRDTD